MPNSAHYHSVAWFQETTSGTGPANAAAWVSSGNRMAPVRGTVDVSGIGEELVPDERATERINQSAPSEHGIDNPQAGCTFEFSALDAVTSDTNQASANEETDLWGHILGGQERGYSTTAANPGTHSATTIELAATTGMDEGQYVAAELSAYTRNVSACHLRRVTDLSGSTITVDAAFPATPADDDPVHAVITAYYLESELIDSTANNSTLSWLFQRGPTGGGFNWEVVGSKAQVDSIELTRNGLAKFAITVFGGSSSDPSEAPSPSWTTEPPTRGSFIVGPDCQVQLEDYGSTTNGLVDCSAFNITPGVPVSPDEVLTDNTVGQQGLAGFTTRAEDTMIELSASVSATEFQNLCNDWDANTLKRVRFSTLRPAGENFGISFNRCQIMDVSGTENGDAFHVMLTLKALEDTVNSAAANEDLWRSKIAVHWY